MYAKLGYRLCIQFLGSFMGQDYSERRKRFARLQKHEHQVSYEMILLLKTFIRFF